MNIISLTHSLHMLKKGGHLIFYLTSFYENISLSILILLQSCFDQVHIYHPHFYSYSWANWIICENYNGMNKHIIDKLIKIINNIPSINPDILINRKFNTLINPHTLDVILNKQRFNMANFYTLGKEMIKRVDFYMNPPKFKKNEYYNELIQFYRNYLQSIDISLLYINKTIPLNRLNLKEILFVDVNSIDIYTIFLQKKYNYTMVNINSNVIISKLSKKYNLSNINVYYNINFLKFFKKKYSIIYITLDNNITLVELLELFNYTTDYLVILFYVNNTDDNINIVKCFLNQIINKVKIIQNNFHVILKKIKK